MRITTIAFANLKRRKGKAIFLSVGISIGIGTAVALLSLSGSIKEEIGAQLDRFGANIIVLPQSNSLSLDYGGITVSGVSFDVHQLADEDAKKILEIPYNNRLSLISPKLLSVINVEGQQVLLAGVDFKSEMVLKRWWHIVGRKPEGDGDVLVGYEAARALSLVGPEPRSHVQTVSSMPDMPEMAAHDGGTRGGFEITKDKLQIAGREHRVVGVLAPTGGPDDRIIFGALPHVQSLLNKPGQLSLIEVSALCKDCPVGDIVTQISEKLPHAKVSAIQQSVRARTETVERLTRFSAAVAAVVLAIGALMIFTTMMGAVVERTKEIGVLRAIGFRRTHIVKGLVIEVAAISVVGGLFGWAAGTLASWLALPYFAETGVAFHIQPVLALVAIVAAVMIGVLSSFYPIIRASRLDPSEAVRYV
ncbi:MAG TPA: FtsX-like permease family protein [Blastocatellia bacterium]|nr:FtsX-like permease family protein [Blastocatellia bacterium]